MQPLAAADRILSDFSTNLSRSISLSVFDQEGHEIAIGAKASSPIEMIIPRDPNLRSLPMTLQNVTSLNDTVHNLLFNLHFVKLAFDYSVSLHLQMRPLNSSLAYLLIYAFDRAPRLNRSVHDIDGWRLFCPSSKCNSIDEEAHGHISLSSCRHEHRLSLLSQSSTNIRSSVSYFRLAWIDSQRNTRSVLQSVDEPGSVHPISTVSFHIRLSTWSLRIRLLLSWWQPTVAIGRFTGNSLMMNCWMLLWLSRLGGTFDWFRSHAMLLHTFDHVCRWFPRSTCADQLEQCLFQCRFHAKQNHLFDGDYCFGHLSSTDHLCASQR